MNPLRRFIWFWLPVLAYMCLIFYFSSGPVPKGISDLNQPDYVLHAIEYAGLAALLFRALNRGFTRPGTSTNFVRALIVATLYGFTDELHQWFVPTRDASLKDVFSDFMGSLFAVSLIFLYQRWKKISLANPNQ